MSATALVTAFRVVSVAEAVSWIGLLIGMYFKWIARTGEVGVQVFGPIHGAVFVAYLVVALLTARAQRWSLWTTALALGASVPPLLTLLFERWARRRGHLDPTAATRTATV